MDEDLIGIGAGGYTDYGDGSWEQVWDDGSVTQGMADGSVWIVNAAGDIVSETLTPTDIPADSNIDAGIVRNAAGQLFKYVFSPSAQKYRAVPMTAAQARLAAAPAKNDLLLPLLAGAAFFLLK